jgi:hypothetical protein
LRGKHKNLQLNDVADTDFNREQIILFGELAGWHAFVHHASSGSIYHESPPRENTFCFISCAGYWRQGAPDQFLQLAILIQVFHNVRATDQFALEEEPGKGRPIGVILPIGLSRVQPTNTNYSFGQ